MSSDKSQLNRSFLWLNGAQFFGALNDNAFKLFIIFYLINKQGPDSAAAVTATVAAVFVVPFLLFPALAGVWADRYSKRRIVVGLKTMEVGVMLLGTASFFLGSEAGLYVVLFLMATQSAFFSPSKFGIIPELVETNQLSRANSFLVGLTYLAIIIGSGAAPFIWEISDDRHWVPGVISACIAVTGLAFSLPIERTPPAGTTRKASVIFFMDIWRTIVRIRHDRFLIVTVLAIAYFLGLGAFVQMNIIPFGMQSLELTEEKSAYLFLLTALGIGIGALLAGKLSGRNVEFGLVPLGALGLTASTILLMFVSSHLIAVCGLMIVLGVSAGLFVVPLNAFIQLRCARDQLGETLAASSFLSWVCVLIAAALMYLFSQVFLLEARMGFLIVGLMTLALSLVSVKMLPDFLIRFIGISITRTFYRIKPIGLDHVPVDGPALLVSNHMSWVDAMIILATQQRRIRFLMYRKTYEKRIMNPLFRLMRVIPVSFDEPAEKIEAALREARHQLDEGYLVCIFPEGALSRTGLPGAFKPGLEQIVKNSDHPIIPMYLGGAWGSIFSYYHGKIGPRFPLQFPYPVHVIFGEPMPPTAEAHQVRDAVMELSCMHFQERKRRRRTLGSIFVMSARKNWRSIAVSDSTGAKLTFGRALIASLAGAEMFRKSFPSDEKISVLLPPTVAGALVNIAITLAGKVPVNLNYTVSQEAFESSLAQCGAPCVITSRAFLEKLGTLVVPDPVYYVEDLLPKVQQSAGLRHWFKARCAPLQWVTEKPGSRADDLATIIFSSGSTGEPKGVMLSHHNIVSNIEGMREIFTVSAEDDICGALPFFHSFGFTGTLWFPLISGFSASYHSNPLDGTQIARMVRENRSTILLATPTFLLAYIRRAKPEDFKTLRLVIVGAEKLKSRVAESFKDRFGVQPLEGYGATELSPVAAMNVINADIDGVFQVGVKEGSVGHPLPGVAVRVVDPDTMKPLPPDEPGLLLIKGPNVMVGYLDRPDLTAEVVRDGWYTTGDIAKVDGDGFITITDRLSRFSKIGGEMVPHVGVEEEYMAYHPTAGQELAVTSVPDEKRGEKLFVVYTAAAGTPEELHKTISESKIPNLWKPAKNSYVRVEALPLLGSGKLDLKAIKAIAENAIRGQE